MDETTHDEAVRQEVQRVCARIERLLRERDQTRVAQRLALSALLLAQERREREQRRPWWRFW